MGGEPRQEERYRVGFFLGKHLKQSRDTNSLAEHLVPEELCDQIPSVVVVLSVPQRKMQI